MIPMGWTIFFSKMIMTSQRRFHLQNWWEENTQTLTYCAEEQLQYQSECRSFSRNLTAAPFQCDRAWCASVLLFQTFLLPLEGTTLPGTQSPERRWNGLEFWTLPSFPSPLAATSTVKRGAWLSGRSHVCGFTNAASPAFGSSHSALTPRK